MREEAVTKTQGRRAIILFSDGEDNGSKTSLSGAIEAAQRADTLVYSVRFYDPNMNNLGFGGGRRGRRGGGFPGGGSGRGDRVDGKKVLQRISEETGGAYFEVSGGMTLEKIYARHSGRVAQPVQPGLHLRPTRGGIPYDQGCGEGQEPDSAGSRRLLRAVGARRSGSRRSSHKRDCVSYTLL